VTTSPQRVRRATPARSGPPDPAARRPPPGRGIYCNRTLNLRSIRAIGYDMDYTLIHYRIEEWERQSYRHVQRKLLDHGWPVKQLSFDPEIMIRGLIIDTELGNLLKVNRFGYVKRVAHGTAMLDFERQRDAYARTIVGLSEPRYVFLNTLFSVSEACMYAQLVELLDAGRLPDVMGSEDLYHRMRRFVDEAHMEGQLKAEIVADPERFIELDPEAPLALLDQREAGKKLLLITNSEWDYTRAVMTYAFDRYLPASMTWRDVFDVIIVAARKPHFFSGQGPLFEIVSEDGLLRPVVTGLRDGGVYLGGHAGLVEQFLGISGADILYVGDHIYVDVNVSKNVLRWRTALILRELEDELAAQHAFAERQQQLQELMARKEAMELEYSQLRLDLQRRTHRYGPPVATAPAELEARMARLRTELRRLDEQIAPLAMAAGELVNRRWGPLMRVGNDKSHLARQVERYADIYTSRVSNFLYETPFVFLRSPRGSLPHDPR
jgi:HAD superfamily 5'-nucleotidase-like hydrolase